MRISDWSSDVCSSDLRLSRCESADRRRTGTVGGCAAGAARCCRTEHAADARHRRCGARSACRDRRLEKLNMHHAFKLGDAEHDVALSRSAEAYRLHLGDAVVDVDLAQSADGRSWLTLGDGHLEVVFARPGEDATG